MQLTEINQLLKAVDREVWVVTAASEGQRGGLLATFVSSISIVPSLPRLAVALSKQHHTWGLVQASKAFAVHLLTAEQIDLAWHFGMQSGRTVDKFQSVIWTPGITGSPILSVAEGWLECRVESRLDTGDRTLYLAEVVDGGFRHQFSPLTQRQLIERASPDRLQMLRDQLAADAALDARAIQQWRDTFQSPW